MTRASKEGVPWEEQKGKSHKKKSSHKASIKCDDGSKVIGGMKCKAERTFEMPR